MKIEEEILKEEFFISEYLTMVSEEVFDEGVKKGEWEVMEKKVRAKGVKKIRGREKRKRERRERGKKREKQRGQRTEDRGQTSHSNSNLLFNGKTMMKMDFLLVPLIFSFISPT